MSESTHEGAAAGMSEATVEPHDPRRQRMVTLQVALVLQDGRGLRLEGYSTGLNEHGLAGRFNVVGGDIEAAVAGHPMRVLLDLPKEKPFGSIEAEILRVESSWVPGYRYFVALRFTRISPEDISFLRQFVHWREDRYFRPAKPPRTWYLFSSGERKQYGPLTTEEVMGSLKQGIFSDRDMIWSVEQGGWVKFSEETFLENAAETRRERSVLVLAALLAIVLLGGGLVGYQQGWLDFGGGGSSYREGVRLLREGQLHLAMQKFNDVVRFYEGTRWAERAGAQLQETHRRARRQEELQLADERLKLLKELPTDKQTHPLVLNNLGDCRFRRGEYQEALDLFLQALAKNPESKRVHYNIGTTYLRLGNYETALSHFAKVGDELSNVPALHLNIGIANLAQGRRAEALDSFDRAVRLDPEDQEIRTTIARALQVAGR